MNDEVHVYGVSEEILQCISLALSSQDSVPLAWQEKSTEDSRSGFKRIRQTENASGTDTNPGIIHFKALISWAQSRCEKHCLEILSR